MERNIKILLLVVGLTAIVLSSGKIFNYNIFDETAHPETTDKDLSNLNNIFENSFEGFDHYNYDKEVDAYYIYDKDNERLGSVLFSSSYCEDIKGFGGNIYLAIDLDPYDKIKNVRITEHSETNSWLDRLYRINFLDSWNGLTIEEAINADVDATSGATLSSNAIIETLVCRLSEYSSISASVKRSGWLNITGIIASFLVLVIAIFSFFVPKQAKPLRLVLLLASIGILGFWQGDFLSIALFNNWLINGVNIKSQIFLFIVLIISISLPLITNKSFYCQYLCPFGAAQEIAGKLNKKKVTFNNQITRVLKSLRNVFLFVIAILLVVAVDINIENLEPFSAFKFQYASLSVLILAVVMLFLSVFFTKPWCRFFCPTGALLSIFRGNTSKMKHKRFSISLIVNIIFAIVILIMAFYIIRYNKDRSFVENDKSVNMENILDVIYNRKSVRNFTDQPVEREKLEILVKAGMAAPSARNLQPWVFVIVQDRNIMNILADSLPNARMLKNAQAAIIVCGDITKAYTDVDEAYWVQDCCAASQNILLAAEAVGLGAVWTAAYPYKERIEPVKNHLNLPEYIIPLNVIPIGYPTGEDKVKDKWKEENLRWEKW
ncbi:MAG: nitroreductase family protein [Bacteroidales bacterium]|jgi:nitroreductase/Na+-translocating ferredoxin:NAD+ oxidoreductase RnfG subunit|nr:nitroreductase family protein [Bacteroidales bacterium]